MKIHKILSIVAYRRTIIRFDDICWWPYIQYHDSFYALLFHLIIDIGCGVNR